MAKAIPVEDPSRLVRFRTAVSDLEWAGDSFLASLDKLYGSVEDLAQAEIEYYYKSRMKSRAISLWSRIIAWASGTVGLLIPLVSGAVGKEGDVIAPWGYVALALAGSAIAANSLFAGSVAHYRNTSAQLRLEQLLVVARIDWGRVKHALGSSPTEEDKAEAFELVRSLANGFHLVLGDETETWAKDVQEALASYSKQIPVSNPTSLPPRSGAA